ncbi:hypothetical protein H6P81_020690 [Aristolochia fimbriata]|uniref:Uncharacterized protein n=1 Tax=Aristolochia fimbriata TaxID=158543 RepID=A0AAV7DV33_ARIFI|nr:hypothetical protein H6P81_020690 [Aristolochia fimbriata]
MPKRKRAVKKKITERNDAENTRSEEQNKEKELHDFSNREAERRIAAIRAICNAEIETLLMQLRLARSFLTKEHLESPALDFFKKNLPDISVIQNEHSGEIEFDWKNACNLHRFTAMGKEPRASFLPDMSHFDFSSRSVETAFLQAAKSHIPDLVWEEMSETHFLGLPDGFQTPGARSQRLSVSSACKTIRQPKHGEMLLSVHGSPLGVYKEDNNMETIQESGEG